MFILLPILQTYLWGKANLQRHVMATQKLYAGAKLREIRTRLGLTQKDFEIGRAHV